jgi:hypothetical protein
MTATPVVSGGVFLLSADEPLPHDANTTDAIRMAVEVYVIICFIVIIFPSPQSHQSSTLSNTALTLAHFSSL